MKQKLHCFLMLVLFSCFFILANAQTRRVTGKVKDNQSQPLPNITVNVSGTKIVVQTDANGVYTIPVPPNAKFLDISSVGFAKKTVQIGTVGAADVTLEPENLLLDEVVVGAGGIKTRKREQGYTSTIVNTQQLTEAKPVNLAAGLTGKVAGLQVNAISNGMNPTVRLVLRGNRSLLGDNTALLVVDNVVVPNSILGNLNPEDVEDINVLNGAGAAALYGSDASNGAIIITTKKGRSGTAGVKVSNTTTLQQVSFYPELQNKFGSGSTQYVQEFLSYENQQYGPAYDGTLHQIGRPLKDGTIQQVPYSSVDDRKTFWKTGITNQTDLSIQQGDERGTTYVALQYVDVAGVTPKNNYGRFSIRANGSRNVGKTFKISYNTNYVQNRYDQTSATSSMFTNLLNTPSWAPINSYQDYLNNPYANPQGYFNDFYPNPYFTLSNNREKIRNDYLIGSAELNWKPAKGIDFTYRVGLTTRNNSSKATGGKFTYDTYYLTGSKANIAGSVTDGSSFTTQLNADFLATFSKRVYNDDISLDLTLGNSVRNNTAKTMESSVSGLVVPGLYNLSNSLNNPTATESNTVSRQYGVYAKFKAGYKNYLFLEFTGRNDWVSVLEQANNSFFYPSVNLSFIPTDAFPFLEKHKFMDNLKIRGGWSKVGNVNIDPYSLLPTFSQASGFPYTTGAGYALGNRIVASGLKPEVTTSWETGFDLDLLNNRINTGLTYYTSNTIDQTVPTGVSTTTGYSSYLRNTGGLTNKGAEALLHVTPVKTKNWSFVIGGNYTYSENKVTYISSDLDRLNINGRIYAQKGLYFPVIIGSTYKRDPQGRIIVDGKTGYPSKNDLIQVLGNTNPKHRLGLDATLKYKNFRLWALFEYRGGFVVYQNGGGTFDFSGSSVRSVWYNRERFVMPNSSFEDPSKPGTYIANTNVTVRDGGAGFWPSSAYVTGIDENYVTKGDFWKMRELSLTYNVPQSFLNKSRYIKGATMSVQGRNLFIWLPKSNMYGDPETNSTTDNAIGVTSFGEPPARFYGATISLNF